MDLWIAILPQVSPSVWMFDHLEKMDLNESNTDEPNDVGVYHPYEAPVLKTAIIELELFNAFRNKNPNDYFRQE